MQLDRPAMAALGELQRLLLLCVLLLELLEVLGLLLERCLRPGESRKRSAS